MQRHLAIVLEHVPGGTLQAYADARGALPEEKARWGWVGGMGGGMRVGVAVALDNYVVF